MEISSNAGHKRNLRLSPEEYAKRLWDWTELNECFKRKIRFTDIDGMVEVNNHFLFIEGKSSNGQLPKGQRMALERLSKNPSNTVIILEGNPPFDITGWQILGKEKQQGDREQFKALIKSWFEYADKSNRLIVSE